MRPRSDRCPTSSGAFRCDFATGHTGPCETVQPATPWVGPAARRSASVAPRAVPGADVRSDGAEVVPSDTPPKNITRNPIEGASHG